MARKKETNPNGANQYLLDPRQITCWEFYIDPKSETFGNATQSAIKAGYEEATANQITTFDWFIGKRRRLNMLSKAERNLDKVLDTSYESKKGIQADVMRIVVDVSKTIATTLGKNEGYSSKVEQEHTNPDGNLKTIIINKNGSSDKPTS